MYRQTSTARIWAIIMIILIGVINIATVFAAAVVITIEDETSVVRASTTNEVQSAKVKMPEIDIETLTETNVQYLTVSEEEEKPDEYIVQSGDNLWSIAEEVYGDGSYYPYLMETNDLEKETVYTSQTLKLVYFDLRDKDEILEECYEYMKLSNKKTSTSSSSAINNSAPSKDGMTYIGNFKITGYNPWCVHCCGKSNGITASGTEAVVGRTIAAKGYAFGTKLYIEGYGVYVVEDRGVGPGVIDVAASSHEACYDLTSYNVPVYIIN